LVLSVARRAPEETSPPHQQDLEMLTPVISPRASSPKRARIEFGEELSFLAGSSTTPSLDDVSTLTAILYRFLSVAPLNLYITSFATTSDETLHQSQYSIYWVP
jgi:hypothetical protein